MRCYRDPQDMQKLFSPQTENQITGDTKNGRDRWEERSRDARVVSRAKRRKFKLTIEGGKRM